MVDGQNKRSAQGATKNTQFSGQCTSRPDPESMASQKQHEIQLAVQKPDLVHNQGKPKQHKTSSAVHGRR